jgi:hypothetical protein
MKLQTLLGTIATVTLLATAPAFADSKDSTTTAPVQPAATAVATTPTTPTAAISAPAPKLGAPVQPPAIPVGAYAL